MLYYRQCVNGWCFLKPSILYDFAIRPILRCEMGRFTLRNGLFYSAKWAVLQRVVYQCVIRCFAKDSCCGDYQGVIRAGKCSRLRLSAACPVISRCCMGIKKDGCVWQPSFVIVWINPSLYEDNTFFIVRITPSVYFFPRACLAVSLLGSISRILFQYMLELFLSSFSR